MRPLLHPSLVNGRTGDPAVYVEMLYARGALLFDLGDLSTLATRDLLRVTHALVSHTHMDHFVGFDALLRVSVGREKSIRIVGPAGIIDRVCHKLHAYEWDLVERYATDLIFEATEVLADRQRHARLRFKTGFRREDMGETPRPGMTVLTEPGFTVSAAVLDHHGPCLGYAVEEVAHANVWKNRLAERGLATGPWLQALKAAVMHDAPDDHVIEVTGKGAVPLGELRDLVTLSRGQKIAYVTDVADTASNRAAIAELAAGADLFFIEAPFRSADAEQASARAHLTTAAAGEIARAAGVRRVEPFHFSPRYDDVDAMIGEVMAAFADGAQPSSAT